jgi:hypothetical protein
MPVLDRSTSENGIPQLILNLTNLNGMVYSILLELIVNKIGGFCPLYIFSNKKPPPMLLSRGWGSDLKLLEFILVKSSF